MLCPLCQGGVRVNTLLKPQPLIQWSRMASQCSFAVETTRGIVAFTPSQVKRVEFLGNYVKQREATLRRPQQVRRLWSCTRRSLTG
jgi:hypothetical protein